MRVQVSAKPLLEKDPFLPRLRRARNLTRLGPLGEGDGVQADELGGVLKAEG